MVLLMLERCLFLSDTIIMLPKMYRMNFQLFQDVKGASG